MEKESADVQFMTIISECGIHILNKGESVPIEKMKYKICFHPGYPEEPELQHLAYLLKDVTIKSIYKDLNTGYQFNFGQ